MWKALLLLAFVASFDMVISCDDDEKCGPNEKYVVCPDTMCIPLNCSQRGLPVPCPILGPEGNCPGKPACICVENYLRDDTTGECIPSKKCKPPTTTTTTTTESPDEPSCGCGGHPPKCGKNEVWNNCSDTTCLVTKCSELGYPLKCDKKCKPGCVCKGDLVRDDNGVCIPKKDCPSCGGDCNAVSGCGINCGKTCATYTIKNPICPLLCRLNGCDCRDGYVYDPNVKACVRPKDCTPTCKVNEEYSPCINGGCGPKDCSEVGKPNVCRDPVTCIKGCVCVKGYVRAANGTCVPIDKCPPKCTGQNECWDECIEGCSNQTCDSINKTYHCPLQKGCKSGCRCSPGFYRNASNICVPENECPKICCKNEHWVTCYYNCGSESCKDIGKSYSCPAQQKCLSGCRCDKGYCRNTDNVCIPESECQPPTTTTTSTTESPHEPGCGCGGHPPRCGKNEVWNNCSDPSCLPTKCSELGYPLKCDKKCKPGCVCKGDCVRDDNGVCIPKKDCPSCGGDCNAVSGCGVNCGKTCATYKDNKPFCPLFCLPNGCDCKDGYVYDPNVKACVRPKDCTPTCKVNEVYSPCINGGCSPKYCSDVGQSSVCIDPVTCIKGCVCVKGYVRAANGTCVPIDQCPPKCTGQNEYWDECIKGCSNQTCDSINKTYPCPLQKGCKSGCRCSPGFYRNASNICVPENECPKICCKNEHWVTCYYNCGSESCKDIGKSYNCPAQQKCLSGCRCDKGYCRNTDNVCIPESECQPLTTTTTSTTESPHEPGCGCGGHPPRCGKNEVWNNCSDTSCLPTHCSQLGYPLKCDKKCKPGCVCKGDCVRDDNGVCIPKKDCPSCGGDCNATSGCGSNCGKTCATYKDKNPICPPACIFNGCDCRDGYVYDPNVKACVRPKDCTPTCKANEVYSPCINGGCGPKDCSEVGKPNVCIDPVTCIKGCVCVKGYVRAANGTCVPIDKCPPNCPTGEVYDTCPTVPCDGDWCMKTRDSPYRCPVGIVCDKPRCVCGYNMKRDWKSGKCIPITDCPPFKCDCNEEYVACSEDCPGDSCSALLHKPICPKIGIIANCRPKCRCSKGYCRNSKGKCVPDCECHGDSPVEEP